MRKAYIERICLFKLYGSNFITDDGLQHVPISDHTEAGEV